MGDSREANPFEYRGRAAAPAGLFDLGPEPQAATALPARQPIALSFTSAQMLADTGIIWRIGDSAAPHSYATYRWAAPPAQLVQQRLMDRLSIDGPVLTENIEASVPVLQVSLVRFEQVYAPDGSSSQGDVVLQAVLLRNHRAVDSVRLARAAPAPAQNADGGVQALRVATDAAANDLAAWLSTRVSAPSSAPAAAAGLSLPPIPTR